ncbi:DUF4440 domain-containing protein [Sporolactobacillus laevolacticus]|nr:DUF4440 domain-containing protein [Sporolactobacillus laevolacticus]MDN3955144.1 DUF4440 domain-containing protein [Sporolactobacillus laevolacticus]
MDNQIRDLLKTLEQSHLSLEIRKSPEALDNILADDFFEIGSSGAMFYKQDCLKNGVALDELKLYNFDMQVLAPDVVLTTYFINNKTRNRNTLRSSIWKFIDGRWQLLFHQGTVTKLHSSDFNTTG